MIRRIIFGLLWFVLIYIVSCAVTGGVAGGYAGNADPANAAQAGAKAGAAAVEKIGTYLLIGSALFAAVGTYFGFLPGTHRSKEKSAPVAKY